MRRTRNLRNRCTVVIDVLCIILALAASMSLRFEQDPQMWSRVLDSRHLIWLSLVIRLSLYTAFGLYRPVWSYASMSEVEAVGGASVLSTLLMYASNFMLLPALGLEHCVSRSVIILDGVLNLLSVAGIRLAPRLAQDWSAMRDRRLSATFLPSARRILVAGADTTGAVLVREMLANPELRMVPVGVVSEDPTKRGRSIHGVPVLGPMERIPSAVASTRVDEVIIAMPAASGATIRRVRRICHQAGVPCRTIPSIHELLDGKVSVKHLREVRIEDLLRRQPVPADPAFIRDYVRGTRVLVTGAGGSIGSELCRQLAQHDPSELLLLGHGEGSIFTILQEMQQRFSGVSVTPIIADVRDVRHIDRIVEKHRPALIVHAAAHKHVPLMESNIIEAFTNNVLGTRSVLRAAERHGVERLVLISTDKAVNPTSIMGTTKRIAELLVHEAGVRLRMPYVAVRFGNVLGSRGSAIPIFREQIAAGGPVTVTHPQMRRYFMTIPEAVHLLLHAAALGKGGEVFMLDMGDPVRMVDLVGDLIELSGLTPGEDIEIVYTGIRPGEKLCEELVLDHEQHERTSHHKIFVCRAASGASLSRNKIERLLGEIAAHAREMDEEAVAAHLRQLVPESRPPDEG